MLYWDQSGSNRSGPWSKGTARAIELAEPLPVLAKNTTSHPIGGLLIHSPNVSLLLPH